MQDKTIYTIGHSNRSLEDFISMLQSFRVGLLADIRLLPGSRKYPHFDKEQLEQSLPAAGIRYMHFPNLGGRRKAQKDSKNIAWRHTAFRGYADYMETAAFEEAIKELENEAFKTTTAYMCSEAVWWSCHRSLVSDQLKATGWQVMHIMDQEKAKEHPYTAPARIVDGKLTYHGLL